MRKGGLEPPRPCGHRFLRPARLPLRHSRVGSIERSERLSLSVTIRAKESQVRCSVVVMQAVAMIDMEDERLSVPLRTEAATLAHVRASQLLERTPNVLGSHRRLMGSSQYKPFLGCLFGRSPAVATTAVRSTSKKMGCFDSERRQATLDVTMPSPAQAKPELHHQLADRQACSGGLLQHFGSVFRTPRHSFIVAGSLANQAAKSLPFHHTPAPMRA